MSLRTFLGLCEHKWTIERGLIERSRIRVCDSRKFVVGYISIKECELCHAVKGFEL